MFGWLGAGTRKRRATQQLVESDDDVRDVLAQVPESERDAVFTAAAKRLLFDGRTSRAEKLANAALELGPESVDSLLAADDVFAELGQLERCVELCERLVDLTDEAEPQVARLVGRLVDLGRPEEALEVLDVTGATSADIALERAEALVALDRGSEALPILRDLIAHDTARMRSTLDSMDAQVLSRRLERASPLHDSLLAEIEGAEQVVVAAMRQGRLDTHAAVNFALLADSLMVDSSYVPRETTLRAPGDVLDVRFDDKDAWSIARYASATLRIGSVREAKSLFERARDVDGRCFAAYRGLAGVGLVERSRSFQRVDALPSHNVPPSLDRVIVDWPNLTEVERRIVVASAYPLRACLEPLREAGARAVLLPIDVRTVDLPQFEKASGSRFDDDHRAIDALSGVASADSGIAVSRIETILGFVDDHGLVFAHELAHLAYFCIEADNPFAEIYAWAKRAPHVATAYELSNEDEFFAGAYEAYLRRAWDLPNRRVDDTGVYDEVFACFDELARHG